MGEIPRDQSGEGKKEKILKKRVLAVTSRERDE